MSLLFSSRWKWYLSWIRELKYCKHRTVMKPSKSSSRIWLSSISLIRGELRPIQSTSVQSYWTLICLLKMVMMLASKSARFTKGLDRLNSGRVKICCHWPFRIRMNIIVIIIFKKTQSWLPALLSLTKMYR